MIQAAVVKVVGALTKTLKDLVEAGSNASAVKSHSYGASSTSHPPVSSSSSSSSSSSASSSSSSGSPRATILPMTSRSGPVGVTEPSLQLKLPDSVARLILIVWQCPANANTALSIDSFYRLVRLFLRLPHSQSSLVLSAIESYPSHLFASRFLKPLQEHLSLQMLSGAISRSAHPPAMTPFILNIP